MATCIDFVSAVVASNQTATLPPLYHATQTAISFSRNTCTALLLTLDAFTVVDFSLDVSPTPVTTFAYTVYFYRVQGLSMTEVASVVVTDRYASFSKEFTAGKYVVCFSTLSLPSMAGNIVAGFRGFQVHANFQLALAHGETYRQAFEVKRVIAECKETLYYEIVDGSLPPGMYMNGVGQIKGYAPNLDCVEDNAALPPSQNWSFTHNDGSVHPWGRQWRFKVRVSVEGFEEDAFTEEWFCVKVFNNWSLDRDNFLSQAPFITTYEEIETTPVVMPELCPQPVAVEWQPQEIPVLCATDVRAFAPQPIIGPCDSCGGDEEVTDAIPIPFGLPSIQGNRAAEWLAQVRSMASQCAEFQAFLDRLESSPVFKQYLVERPVEIVEVNRVVTIRTYTDDPQALFEQWRLEETARLPMGAEALQGESLSINITHGHDT